MNVTRRSRNQLLINLFSSNPRRLKSCLLPPSHARSFVVEYVLFHLIFSFSVRPTLSRDRNSSSRENSSNRLTIECLADVVVSTVEAVRCVLPNLLFFPIPFHYSRRVGARWRREDGFPGAIFLAKTSLRPSPGPPYCLLFCVACVCGADGPLFFAFFSHTGIVVRYIDIEQYTAS